MSRDRLSDPHPLLQARSVGVLLCALVAGCQPASTTPEPAAKPARPSKVTGGVKEADLAKVELTEDAEKRLGITLPGGLVAVERKPVAKAVSYPGEVMIPSGHLISVTSPFAATLKAPKGTQVPKPGAVVTLGQTIFLTEPNLSPGERATLASVHLAFGRTGTRAEDEEAEDMTAGSAIGSNGPAQASQPAIAAVAVPASSAE